MDIDKVTVDITAFPYFLRHDIEELVKAEQEERATGKACLYMDCLRDELYVSINEAYRERIISKDVAEQLREIYLGISVPLQDI